MIELKPCPFCGKTPSMLIRGNIDINDGMPWFVLTIKCCVEKETITHGKLFFLLLEAANKFINEWNNRHE